MLRGMLLIVIDCLRADHVSAYGYERRTTPTLDELAANGVLWENAHSTSSWTKPSVASMLTGLYPSQHGAFEGIKRSQDRVVTTDRLHDISWTLAEQFARAGWRCGAFINNAQLGEFTGLNRGFHAYVPTAGKADNLIAACRAWLEQDLATPAFAYLHFLEAHWPYKPRRRHVAMFGGDRDANTFSTYSARDYGKLRRAVSRGERRLTPNELGEMVQMYDGAVRRLDGKVKLLRTMLQELKLADETGLVVTADHGEEFLEHGSLGHGHTLYDELTHVPLIAVGPSCPPGARQHDLVSHADLAGTLLALAGVDNEGPSRNLLATGGNGVSSARPVFSELRTGRRYQQSWRTEFWKVHRQYVLGPPPNGIVGVESPRQAIRRQAVDAECKLFDVVHDPQEQRGLADDPSFADVLRTRVQRLDRWWRQLDCPCERDGGREVAIDREVVERLHQLGYID